MIAIEGVEEGGGLALESECNIQQPDDSLAESLAGAVPSPGPSTSASTPSSYAAAPTLQNAVASVSRAPSDLSNRSQDPPNQQVSISVLSADSTVMSV